MQTGRSHTLAYCVYLRAYTRTYISTYMHISCIFSALQLDIDMLHATHVQHTSIHGKYHVPYHEIAYQARIIERYVLYVLAFTQIYTLHIDIDIYIYIYIYIYTYTYYELLYHIFHQQC